MKKTLVAGVAALAFATAAFAEITFHTWMRVLPTPVASDGENNVTTAVNSWGWSPRASRVQVEWTSEDERAGMNMHIYGPIEGIELGAPAHLWMKPVDQVKIAYGKFDEGTLRSDLCYGSWSWLRMAPTNFLNDEGITFTAVQNGTGLALDIDPVENLKIIALIPFKNHGNGNGDDNGASHTYWHTNVAVGYTIDGIGTAKVGYFGDHGKYSKNGHTSGKAQASLDGKEAEKFGRIEAAFDLVAVENLFATVGFAYNIEDSNYNETNWSETGWGLAASDANYSNYWDENGKYKKKTHSLSNPFNEQMKIALGASYQVMPELKVSASGKVLMYDKKGYEIDPRFGFGVGIDYQISDVLAFNADVRYLSESAVKQTKDAEGNKIDGAKKVKLGDDAVSFSAGILYSVGSNASIGVAFQGITNGGDMSGVDTGANDKGEKDGFKWAVPVALSIWF